MRKLIFVGAMLFGMVANSLVGFIKRVQSVL